MPWGQSRGVSGRFGATPQMHHRNRSIPGTDRDHILPKPGLVSSTAEMYEHT